VKSTGLRQDGRLVPMSYGFIQERTEGGRGGGCRRLPGCILPNPPKPTFKTHTDFVDIMLSKVLLEFSFSRNQPPKSADDWYIRILKNKLIKFRKKQEDMTRSLSEETFSYICKYVNEIVDNVMLYLQHDFYSTI
jgi:hypothetical protein